MVCFAFEQAGILRGYSPYTMGMAVPALDKQTVRDLEILNQLKENAYYDERTKNKASSAPNFPCLWDLFS